MPVGELIMDDVARFLKAACPRGIPAAFAEIACEAETPYGDDFLRRLDHRINPGRAGAGGSLACTTAMPLDAVVLEGTRVVATIACGERPSGAR